MAGGSNGSAYRKIPRSATLGELREETGINHAELSYYPSLPTIYPYRGMVYHILDIILTANFSESPAVVARDNLAALLWIDRTQADVHRIALPSLREAVRRYLATS